MLLSLVDVRVRLGGISRTKLHELLASGQLPSCKLGRRRLVSERALEDFIATLEGSADSAAAS